MLAMVHLIRQYDLYGNVKRLVVCTVTCPPGPCTEATNGHPPGPYRVATKGPSASCMVPLEIMKYKYCTTWTP